MFGCICMAVFHLAKEFIAECCPESRSSPSLVPRRTLAVWEPRCLRAKTPLLQHKPVAPLPAAAAPLPARTPHGATLLARSCPPLCIFPLLLPGAGQFIHRDNPLPRSRGWVSMCEAALFQCFCNYFIRKATRSIPALSKPKAAGSKCLWYDRCGYSCKLFLYKVIFLYKQNFSCIWPGAECTQGTNNGGTDEHHCNL